jgi:hypothetical protein
LVLTFRYGFRTIEFEKGKAGIADPEDTEFGVLMEPELGRGEAEVYTRVQA